MYKILEDLKSVALRAFPFMFLAHKKHIIKGFEIFKHTHSKVVAAFSTKNHINFLPYLKYIYTGEGTVKIENIE